MFEISKVPENRKRFEHIYKLLGKFIIVRTEQDLKNLDNELYLTALSSYRHNFKPFVVWFNGASITHNQINDYIHENFMEELANAIDSSIINRTKSPELFI